MEHRFLTSSIGKKVIIAASGMFLMTFVLVHLTVNLTLILDDSGALFNRAAHFMATNPIIRIVEPILALGFGVHIFYSLLVTWQNMRSRPVKYARQDLSGASSWASRNMFILGGLLATFLIMHLFHFFVKMKFTGDAMLTDIIIDGVKMENGYLLVSTLFKTSILYCTVYIFGAVFLGLHLTHGFWSSFQSIGLNNKLWYNRLRIMSIIFASIISTGFSIIPIYFILFY